MQRDPGPPEDKQDPLDAALGEVLDLAELEQRFALLDARMQERETALDQAGPDMLDAALDEDDPFADIARALHEQRAMLDRIDDADDDSQLATDDEAQLELSIDADDGDDSADEDSEEEDPLAAEIESQCHEALDALEIDDPTLARELAMAAVRLDDEHPFPMFVLGLIAEREGDLDTARDMAELSLRTAGTNPDAIGLRAHIHVRQHELSEAEDLLRFGIAHNPDEAILHEGLARVTLARGHHEDALQAAATTLRIEPGNAGAIAVRAAALHEDTDRTGVLAVLRQGVQLHPDDPYAMVELASVEMELGNLERARMLLMRAQRLAPRDREISDVRVLVDHVHGRPLLRPVPALVRWMRDFPGGLAGFLVGFVIAALPLHALATTNPAYRIPAITIMLLWGSVALYAWVAPAVLTHRLNQRAARSGADRLADELRDPLASMPSIERVSDVMILLATAHDRRGAADIAALAARRAHAHGQRALDPESRIARDAARPLEVLASRMRGPRPRLRAASLIVPGMSRLLVAVAVAVAVAAPMLADATTLALLAWHALAAACLATSWLFARTSRLFVRDVEDACTAIRLVTVAQRD